MGKNTRPDANRSVFINCPFDASYLPLFQACVFAVQDCGFIARSALESDNGAETRIEKIKRIIAECKFGIHDLSCTGLSGQRKLPRFNMPLELGLFLGAQHYGAGRQRDKVVLILDRERYRYKEFISDIGGQDVHSHQGKEVLLITSVRDWLRSNSTEDLPGPRIMHDKHRSFKAHLGGLCRRKGLRESELTFVDYTQFVSLWLASYDAALSKRPR